MGIDTLVEDIYKLVSTKEVPDGVDLEEHIEKFGENIKQLMRDEFKPSTRDTRRLRLSLIGRTDKYIWNQYNGTDGEEIQPHTFVKFMYGHVIEELLLFLTKASGHVVTNEQKVCKVEGVVGHMDCSIDGIVTDVKSTSTYGFRKFKDGTLAKNDPFGYIGQIKAYAYSEGETKYGWLAMDKQNGHLTYLMYDEEDAFEPMQPYINYDIAERIRCVKKLVEGDEPSEVCYEAVPDGKSGNLKLAIGCSYCQYKEHCYPNLRTFAYSNGPKHLIKVVSEPRVREEGGKLPDGF